MNDLEIQAQAYAYFLGEAPELLQTIEYEILTIPNEHTTTKVHSLMRALHLQNYGQFARLFPIRHLLMHL